MFSPELIIFPSEPGEKELPNVYNHRLMIWFQDSVGDGFWDSEGKLASFMNHHVVSQLAMCFLSNSCWFQVWARKVCFEMIQRILSGYICLLNLIKPYKLTVNVVCSTMKEWFHSLPVPAFQIIFLLFFFFLFKGVEGGCKKREK